MFGLSSGKTLEKAILRASKNYLNDFLKDVDENAEMANNSPKDESDKMIMKVRRDYFDLVSNSVINTLSESSVNIATRIRLALMSPSMTGYDFIDIEEMNAGSLYAICYFAINNKKAKLFDLQRINQLQEDMMNKALGV